MSPQVVYCINVKLIKSKIKDSLLHLSILKNIDDDEMFDLLFDILHHNVDIDEITIPNHIDNPIFRKLINECLNKIEEILQMSLVYNRYLHSNDFYLHDNHLIFC